MFKVFYDVDTPIGWSALLQTKINQLGRYFCTKIKLYKNIQTLLHIDQITKIKDKRQINTCLNWYSTICYSNKLVTKLYKTIQKNIDIFNFEYKSNQSLKDMRDLIIIISKLY